MGIQWTQDLAVGYAEIDRQHQDLFEKINQLLNACTQSKGRESVGEVIQFLADYVVFHFGSEEKLMKQYQYDGYQDHKPCMTNLSEDLSR